jgi:putative FmdB family regulatory protein
MPFYEYECGACGKSHEALQKVSDPPLHKCPACGKPRLRKQMSAPIFRLKGSGWYETDFKSDQDKKRNLAVEKDETPKTEAPKVDATKADATKAEPAKKDSKSETASSTDKSADKSASKPEAKAAASKKASRSASKTKRAPARKSRR